MANTLNLGNGDWATKENSLLGYNSENGNYKPLPFDFTRASSATVVNKSGLIETAANGTPRIDFLGNTSGALLLEPQRTNLIPYSDRFNSPPFWSQVALTVSNNATISPDGTLNASKITRTSTSGNARLVHSSVAVSSGAKATLSAFFKYNDTDEIILFSPITLQGKRFSLQNATAGADFVSAPDGYGIENYGNGWYRFYIVVTAPSTSVDFTIYVQNNATTSIYLFGAQIELGSYATSLINTQGSAVTRVADACLKDDFSILTVGNSYTLFFDVDLNEKDDNKTFFNIERTSGSTSFTVRSVLTGMVRVYNNLDSQYPTGNLASSTSKWVVRIDGTSFKIFGAEGSLSGTLTTARDMGEGIFGRFSQTKINDFKVYNTALSDSECEALTQV